MKKPILLKIATLVIMGICFSTKHISAQFVNIPDANFKALLVADLTINSNGDAEIQLTEAAVYAGSIDASSSAISDLTGIEAFTALTALDCGFNNISTLDLSYNVSLTTVTCTSNSMSNLNVTGLTALTTLNCTINNLTCLDLHTNTSLTSLNCGSNNLTSLNLKNGNNTNMSNMNSMSGGGMLYCIQVDNASFSTSSPFWYEDTWSVYNTVCGTAAIASFSDNSPQCIGTPIAFTNASSFSNTYHWDFGDGSTSVLMNPIYTFSSAGAFIVSLIASNCNSSDTTGYTIYQGTDVTGHVSYSGGPVTNGTAVLMPDVGFYTTFDTCQTSPLDAAGDYHFYQVGDGNYVIKVFADTITYPSLIPTYYGNDWAWDSSLVLTHGCYTPDVADITMVELPGPGTGPGFVQGYVIEGPGFGRAQGDPIHGVDVKLGITGTSSIVDQTSTDTTTGAFHFNSVNFGSYTVFVDIPGLERDSVYSFTISAGNPQAINLYYVVDSVKIYIVPGIGIENYSTVDLNTIKVYPNPVIENTIIEYSIKSDANVKLEVYNIYGIKVQSLVNADLNSGDYYCNFSPKTNALKSGIYFITLSADGKRKTVRIMVLE
jgi:PKD repeat protein